MIIDASVRYLRQICRSPYGQAAAGGRLRNAHLKLARFDGADLREADLGGLMLYDAKLFRGATISRQQATVLLGELGLKVA